MPVRLGHYRRATPEEQNPADITRKSLRTPKSKTPFRQLLHPETVRSCPGTTNVTLLAQDARLEQQALLVLKQKGTKKNVY